MERRYNDVRLSQLKRLLCQVLEAKSKLCTLNTMFCTCPSSIIHLTDWISLKSPGYNLIVAILLLKSQRKFSKGCVLLSFKAVCKRHIKCRNKIRCCVCMLTTDMTGKCVIYIRSKPAFYQNMLAFYNATQHTRWMGKFGRFNIIFSKDTAFVISCMLLCTRRPMGSKFFPSGPRFRKEAK